MSDIGGSKAPKTLDLKDLTTKLGLQDPYSYIENNRHGGRGLGYTTLMLLNAVVASQYQPVLILGYCGQYSRDLQLKARMMAMKAGLSIDNILCLSISFNSPENLKAMDCQIFEDHYFPVKGL